LLEGEDVASADFGFELILCCLEESFDESTRRWVSGAAVCVADVEGVTGRLECLGFKDPGLVDVDLPGSAMRSPDSQKTVHENVEILAEVIASLDKVAAVAIDEGTEMRLDRLALVENVRTFLKIADP
jgi:hypothetical protein